VLVVVDDAHWLDDASAAALLFAARDGDARRFDAGDLPTVVLDGLLRIDGPGLPWQ